MRQTITQDHPELNGKQEIIHGLNTYVVGKQTDPRAIVVMFTDEYGLYLPQIKIIADSYARSSEWLVYVPDFYKGDTLDPEFIFRYGKPISGRQKWTRTIDTKRMSTDNMAPLREWRKRHEGAVDDEICNDFLQALRRSAPRTLKIGLIGYDWGSRPAIRAGLQRNMIELDGNNVPLVDAVAALQPSRLGLPVDVETLVVPVTFAWSEEDLREDIDMPFVISLIHANVKDDDRDVPQMEHKVHIPGGQGWFMSISKFSVFC